MNFQKKRLLPRTINVFLIVLVFFSFLHCSHQKQYADLVITNGVIVSVDEHNTIYEAIAIESDTIVSLGTSDEIKKYINDSTLIIDLKGQVAIPGFIDSHAHLIGTGKAQINLNLSDAQNWDEVVYLVALAADKAKKGDWIVGRGWHQEKWNPVPIDNINGYPRHNKLSEATPNNPVMLSHASGHAIFANEKAMTLANITSETISPKGGAIITDENGEPIGVFTEEAERLISSKYSDYSKNKSIAEQINDKKYAISLAIKECLSKGITTLHDAGATFEDIRVIKDMVDSNQVDIRLYEMILEDYHSLKDSLRKYQTVGYGNNHLTVSAIKLYMDGALGSRGAWFLNDYSDDSGHFGQNVTSLSEIKNIAKLAAENDFQICTHAIGDKGNRVALNIYEEIFNQDKYKNNYRWRIEHAQHLSKEDIPRFAELGVIASMQGIHCTSDAPFVEKRLGKERAEEGAYVWNSLLENSTIICNGTDSPVENIDPLSNYYASVTRITKDGNSFFPEQKLSRLDALKTLTINGAYAAFEENLKGSLEIGKLADITILSQNLLTIPDDEILNTEVVYTIVDGKIKYAQK
jgi:predicted amidohydrolase YtcJ